MTYTNNPQAVLNGFHSGTRNMFLTVSVAIAMYGFSGTFNIGKSVEMVKDITLIILLISFSLGLNNVVLFNNYINKLKLDEENVPLYVDFNAWKRYVYITSIFIILLVGLIVAVTIRVIKRRFK